MRIAVHCSLLGNSSWWYLAFAFKTQHTGTSEHLVYWTLFVFFTVSRKMLVLQKLEIWNNFLRSFFKKFDVNDQIKTNTYRDGRQKSGVTQESIIAVHYMILKMFKGRLKSTGIRKLKKNTINDCKSLCKTSAYVAKDRSMYISPR